MPELHLHPQPNNLIIEYTIKLYYLHETLKASFMVFGFADHLVFM